MSPVRRVGAMVGLLIVATITSPGTTHTVETSATTDEPPPSFAEPAVSPDRTELAVVPGRDIWTVPIAGRRSAPPRLA